MYFCVADIEAAVRTVRELGGTAEDPRPEPGFGRSTACTDDQGVQFGLHQQSSELQLAPTSYESAVIPSRSTILSRTPEPGTGALLAVVIASLKSSAYAERAQSRRIAR